MPDIGGIPYVESSDLVSAWPTVSQSVAQEVSDQLASKADDTLPVITTGIELEASGSDAYIDFRTSSAEDFDCRIQQFNNGLAFQTGGDGSTAVRMEIKSNGDTHVGRLNVATSGTGDVLFVTANTGGTSAQSVYVMPIRVGSTQTFVGGINYNGSVVQYNTSSDYRLKENVTPLTGALARIALLKPSTFNFISNPETQIDGFIAHEVSEVVPGAVTGEKDETDENGNPVYQGIDQSKLVPLLVAAVQELQAEVAALKAAAN